MQESLIYAKDLCCTIQGLEHDHGQPIHERERSSSQSHMVDPDWIQIFNRKRKATPTCL